MVPLVQDFPTQKELACHAPDKLLLTVQGFEWVFTILDISLDIMVLWLSINLGFNIYAFFGVHAIGWHAWTSMHNCLLSPPSANLTMLARVAKASAN